MMGRRGRYKYEVLLDKDELQTKKLQIRLLNISFLLVAVVAFVGTKATCSSYYYYAASQSQGGSSRPHVHTIPTLLSMVHHETGEYLMALNNPLYERLKKATFTRHDSNQQGNIVESPTLELDRSKINVRDPLTLTWTLGTDALGNNLLKDEDIIVLYCGHQNDSKALFHPHTSQFLEAATIAQARATSQRHNNGSNQDAQQQWRFPSFPVLRREICQFHLYQALPPANSNKPTYALLDKSNPVKIMDSRSTPTSIHLALGNDPSEMVVQFTTGDEEGTPVARYSKQGSKKSDSKKATGTTHTYTAQDMCGAPANITEAGKFQSPGQIHVVRLADLEPNTEYEYRVGLAHGQGITWADTFTFTSAPSKGDPTPHSYIVYGDQGCPSEGWANGGNLTAALTAREVSNVTNPIRAVHIFGDLSYAIGAAHIWDEWLNMISPFTTKVPLMVGVGNHEYDHLSGGGNGKDPSGVLADDGYQPVWGNFGNDSAGECGVPPANHFTMPNSTGSNGIFWYSFDYGSVHTIVASSEHDIGPGSRQYKWLVQDLQSVNRTATPWLVLEIHRPLYQSQMNWPNNAVGIAMRMELDDLLAEYNVDLVLGGHYHSYLRTCDGLRNSKCQNGGPVHITVGSAGAELSMQDTYPNAWTDVLIRGEFGYGRITVANATAMLFEFVKAGDENDPTAGEVHDSVWILRDR